MVKTKSMKKLAALKFFFLSESQQTLVKSKMTSDQLVELNVLLQELESINYLSVSLSTKERNKIFLAVSHDGVVQGSGWGLVSNRLNALCHERGKAKKLFELVERARMS